MGDVYGWIGLGLGQIVAWPQELELRRDEGNEVSLLTYGLLLVSMSLYLAHAIEILDTVTIVSVPVALVPNMLIAVTLLRRRIARGSITSGPRAATSPACESSEMIARQRTRCETRFRRAAESCCDVSSTEDRKGRLLSRPSPKPRA